MAVLLASGMGVVGWGAGGARADGPAVLVEPDGGPPGSRVKVRGSDFGHCGRDGGLPRVDVLWDGEQIKSSVPVDDDGEFRRDFPVPDDAPAGPHTVGARCAADLAPSAETSFTVTNPDPPVLRVSPPRGRPGTAVVLTGSGYDDCGGHDGRWVRVEWNGEPLGDPVPTVDDGFTARITVPAAARPGEHLVAGRCHSEAATPSPVVASAEFVATVAPTPTATPSRGPARTAAPKKRAKRDRPAATSHAGRHTSVRPSRTAEPSPTPSAATTTSPPAPPAAAVPSAGPPTAAGPGWPRPDLVDSVARWDELRLSLRDVAFIVLAALLATILLVGWPAHLMESTYQQNEHVIRGWVAAVGRCRPIRFGAALIRRLPRRASPDPASEPSDRAAWPVVAVFSVLGALALAAGEPGALWSRETLAVAAGLLVAVPLVVLSYEFTVESYLRTTTGHRSSLRAVVPALAVALLCSAASHYLALLPGYVYGLILTYRTVAARTADRRTAAIAAYRASVVVLAIATVFWLLWQFGTHPVAKADDIPVGLRILDTILAMTTKMGLEVLVIGLLPLAFLHGGAVWAWNRLAWGVTWAAATVLYLVVLRGPGRETTDAGGYAKALALFVGFFLASVAFWAFFAVREHRRTWWRATTRVAAAIAVAVLARLEAVGASVGFVTPVRAAARLRAALAGLRHPAAGTARVAAAGTGNAPRTGPRLPEG